MTALCIVLGVLLLIGLTPVGGKVCCDQGTLTVKLIVGPLCIGLVPKKPVHGKKAARQQEKARLKDLKNQKKKAKKKVLKKRAKAAAKAAAKKPAGGAAKAAGNATAAGAKKSPPSGKPEKKGKLSLQELLPLIRLGLKVAASIPRKLYMKELTVHLTCGGADAAQAAVTYGRICAALGGGLPVLERIFRIKKRDVDVALDYGRDSLDVFARLDVRIRVGTAAGLALSAGFRFLVILIQNQMKKNKLEKAVQNS